MQDPAAAVSRVEFRVQCSGLSVWGLGSGLGFRVWGFRVVGL